MYGRCPNWQTLPSKPGKKGRKPAKIFLFATLHLYGKTRIFHVTHIPTMKYRKIKEHWGGWQFPMRSGKSAHTHCYPHTFPGWPANCGTPPGGGGRQTTGIGYRGKVARNAHPPVCHAAFRE
jgi:hypothetical protein